MKIVDKELEGRVLKIVHDYKNEILKNGDWWHAIDNFDINVHCPEDHNFDQPDAIYHINLYELDRGDTSSYEASVQIDLTPMTRREIRLL